MLTETKSVKHGWSHYVEGNRVNENHSYQRGGERSIQIESPRHCHRRQDPDLRA